MEPGGFGAYDGAPGVPANRKMIFFSSTSNQNESALSSSSLKEDVPPSTAGSPGNPLDDKSQARTVLQAHRWGGC